MTEYTLRDLLTIKNGRDHKDLADGKYPVYGSGGIMRYVDAYLYDKPSILLPRKGSLSNIQFCETPFWTVDTTYYTEINETLCDPYYLYRYLTLLNLASFDSGSTVPSMTFDSYYHQKVLLPSLSEQKRASKVLRNIDNKIQLNEQINRNLEELARLIYDYWFIQFDFPDKNGKPYKTSGGKMVYNDQLKREIPAGWEVNNITPLMEILPGGTPSKAKPEYWNGDIPFFGPTDYCGDVFQLSTEELITEKGLNNCASALYPPKTIFITARGSVGKLIVCGKPMAMNQSCYALKPFDLEKYEYLFYLTKQLIEQLKKKGSGSVFKSINTLDIEQSFLSIAPDEIIDLYCKKVKSIFERIKSNTVEIAELTTLRDRLLPLLMNGQVSVGNQS